MRLTPLVTGAAAGAATFALADRISSRVGSVAPVASLPVLAGIYTSARRRGTHPAAERLEWAALAVYSGAAVIGATSAPGPRRRLAAVAWGAHAAFDVVHPHDAGSRLPSWYGAFCLGYDVAAAAVLARS